MGFSNPFKRRQPGGIKPNKKPIEAPFPGYLWTRALTALRDNPSISDAEFVQAMGPHDMTGETCKVDRRIKVYRAACEREIERQRVLEAANRPKNQPSQPPPPAAEAGNGATPPPSSDPGATAEGPAIVEKQFGNLTLISYSGPELLRQVEESRSRVSFDLTWTAKGMEGFNQAWSWIGPILFCLGTIGEIFLVLWSRQTEQSAFAAFSIIAVSMISEGTLLAISFSSKRLRNRADKRTSGWTEKEKHKLEVLKRFWFVLMLCVAATQVAFILSQTKQDGIGLAGIITIAIVRAIASGVADAYTAFVSEEKPTSGDQALEQKDRENEFMDRSLQQKTKEIQTLNSGAISVQEAGMQAHDRQKEMESLSRRREDERRTKEELEHMENMMKLETLKQDHAQRLLVDRMRNSAMQAVFDPDMDPQKRMQIITMLTGLMNATNIQLPPPPHDRTVDEEKPKAIKDRTIQED